MNAAIDVGSNSIRLLIGNVCQGVVEPFLYRRQVTRLAGGMTPSQRNFNSAAVEASLSAIQCFISTCASHHCKTIRAVATEALRRSDNASDFVELVRKRTGLTLEILEGSEEARLTAAGARASLTPIPESYLLFDIGGGSSEFILQQLEDTLYLRSFPLGVVTLSECFHDSSVRSSFIRQYLEELKADLARTGLLPRIESDQTVLVGTAGTVTTLAAMNLQMTVYDWRRVNNLQIDQFYLHALQQTLTRLSPEERELLPGMEPKRGDLIVPGLDIVLGIMDTFHKSTIKVSDFGLLEGVLLSL